MATGHATDGGHVTERGVGLVLLPTIAIARGHPHVLHVAVVITLPGGTFLLKKLKIDISLQRELQET